MKSKPACKSSGFSLLEVIAVLALISIFAVIAVVQSSSSDATLVAQTQVLKAHIIYAQMRSMNTDLNWGIHYNHDGDESQRYYELFTGGIAATIDAGDIKYLPGQTQKQIPIGNMGISIASGPEDGSQSARSFQVSFDSWGRPNSSVTLGTLILTLGKTGHTDQQLTITQNTGFIH